MSRKLKAKRDTVESRWLLESDNEDAYPTLAQQHGSIFANIPKRVLAAVRTPTEVLYLVSYHQTY